MNTKRRLAGRLEIKSVSEKGEFSGYGSVFNVKDDYGDVVIKGAFAKSLEAWTEKSALPAMLWQHRSAEPIGVWTKMVEDDHGLYVEGRILLDAGELERRAYVHMREKSVRGLSIGYSVPLGGLEFDKETDAYLLKQIDLWETSLVTFPANADAQVETVKAAMQGGPKEIERLLRDAGFSRSQAKALLADGLSGLRDAADETEAVKTLQSLSNNLRAARG